MFKLNSITLVLLLLSQACSKKELGQNSGFLSSLLLKDTTACDNPFTVPAGQISPFLVFITKLNAQYPCFNPKNPSQIIFVREFLPGLTWQMSIVKLDLSNGNSETIYSGQSCIGDLHWNKNGEIIFVNCRDQQVYLVRDDGTGLKQITNNHFNNGSPAWCHRDSLILIQQDSHRLCFYNTSGSLLDTIPGYWYSSSLDCDPANDILLVNGRDTSSKFAIIHNDYSISRYSFVLSSHGGGASTICPRFNPMNNKEVFLYRTTNGLYKYDLLTGSLTLLMERCGSEFLENFSISPDGKKIAACGNIRLKLPSGDVESHNVLLLMNTDGTDRRIIKIE